MLFLPPLYSVTLTIRKIEQELLAAGHSVLILTTKSGDRNNTHMDGIHANREVLFLDNSIPIPFLEDPNNPTYQYHLGYSLSRDTRAKLDSFEPSIMHITVPDNLCLHLIQYAREKEIPLMGTYHSNIPEYMDHYPGLSWLKPLLGTFFLHEYGFLQSLYVPTPYIHKHLSDTYNMDKATNLRIWGRGIDLQRFSPSHRSLKFRRSLGIDDDDVVICWVGRLVPEKRTDIFANVVRRLHARGVPFHTLIVGRGPSEEEVKSLPNCTFCGWLDGEPLAVAYASSDVFLFPSAVETFGNVTLEAAASGLPLVVEAGCSGHLVNDGVNGFACTDEESFFQATLALCVDDELRESAAQASRQHSLLFEKRAVVQQMLDNYSQVTDEFYCEYGGHHENRDRKYLAQDHAFIAGTHPRPIALASVEFVFITAFRVMTWLWVGFVWFHQQIISEVLMARHVPPPPVHHRAPPVHKSPVRRAPLQRMDTRSLTIMEEGGESDDGETSATDSVGESSSFTSASSTDSEASRSTTNSSASTSCASIGDGPCITGLTSAVIRMIAFQCRVESGIRNSIKSCGRKSLSVVRKRKDSSMSPRPVMIRNISSGSDCSDASRQEDTLKRRLRRSPMSNGSLLLESSP